MRTVYLMRVLTLFLFCLFLSTLSLAQSKILIEGQVIDNETGEPIAYANAGIPGKYIGVSTNQEGGFTLKLPAETQSDTLQISAIGFETKRFEVSKFTEHRNHTISLQPKTYKLNSITVTDKKNVETEWIGSEKVGFFKRFFGRGGGYGEAGFGKNLGASYAFKVKWDKSLPLRILIPRIYLSENKNDWPVRMRCRIQGVDPENGWPGEDFVHQNVFGSVKDSGWLGCDFSDLDVVSDEKVFFVIFDWLPRFDGPSANGIAPLFEFHDSLDSEVYVRRHALGQWEKLSLNLRYSVKVEY